MLPVREPILNDKMKEELIRLNLYRLIDEGLKDIEEGNLLTSEEVWEDLEKRRANIPWLMIQS